MLSTKKYTNNQDLRHAIYAGDIVHYKATPQSMALVSSVMRDVENVFGGDVHHAAIAYETLTNLRQEIMQNLKYHQMMYEIMRVYGFALADNRYDFLRLRAVLHDGHKNALAQPAYSAHRDTWYSNPQTQINWWIAAHDVAEGQSFGFYPQYFKKAVENNSAEFNYQKWKNKQDCVYPQMQKPLKGEASRFSIAQGDILLFSAAHLHQTQDNISGAHRFSLDFRTVHSGDEEQNIGAENVDNASGNMALQDYLEAGI